MFFALYFSSRGTTVDNTSIAGFVIAKLNPRRITGEHGERRERVPVSL